MCCFYQVLGSWLSVRLGASLIPLNLSPKTLNCKGKDVENVFTIRTPEDANRVVRLARGRNAVVVGAGFLGE